MSTFQLPPHGAHLYDLLVRIRDLTNQLASAERHTFKYAQLVAQIQELTCEYAELMADEDTDTEDPRR